MAPSLVKEKAHHTWIHKAFDDPKHIIYLPLSNNVINLHSNEIVLVSQFALASP